MENIGDSGTPLAKKLGIKEGNLVQVLFTPKLYSEFFNDLPSEIILELKAPFSEKADIIHAFVMDEEELEIAFNHALNYLNKNGSLWISWPKKTSGISTRVDKYHIMNYGLSTGLVDVKVAAIDEQWSGLKLNHRIITDINPTQTEINLHCHHQGIQSNNHHPDGLRAYLFHGPIL